MRRTAEQKAFTSAEGPIVKSEQRTSGLGGLGWRNFMQVEEHIQPKAKKNQQMVGMAGNGGDKVKCKVRA